jgi:hypothetical protein
MILPGAEFGQNINVDMVVVGGHFLADGKIIGLRFNE